MMEKLLKSICLSAFILLILSTFVFAEEITITTYYPSPYGSYNSLQVDKLGVGDNNGDSAFTSADVPSTSGNVWIKGNVGIGTTAPTSALQVAGASDGSPDANGVHIGMSGNYAAMELAGSTGSYIDFTIAATDFKGRIIYDNAANAFGFYTNGTVRQYIDASGNVGLGGTTSPAVTLDVNGDIAGDLISTGSTGYVGYVAGTGGGAYKLVRYSSSRRYKDNIGGFNLGLDVVKKMHPVSFTWKSTGDRDFGFIAEDAEKVSPDLITKINGQVETFKYMAYTAVLTNAIQEQQKQIDGLKAEIEKLKKSK
jgi:hypothetical protein